MLKSTIRFKECVKINDYMELFAFIKRKNDGYVSKKTKVFDGTEVCQFLCEAADSQWSGRESKCKLLRYTFSLNIDNFLFPF